MKRIRRILLGFISTLLVVLVVLNIPIITLNKVSSDTDYSSWMSENVSNEQRVLDIAMLGAHDAFSNEIGYTSDVDPYLTDDVFRGVPGSLLKGFLVKQSVTQTGNVTDLLSSGVRYLDIRLSFFEEKWYTKHNYISGEFEPIAEKITEFLDDNPGEVLILDFQHVNGVTYDSFSGYKTFKTMIEDFNLMSYAYEVQDLSTLTYGEITSDGTESKVIIIAPFDLAEERILNYSQSIRSVWANADNFPYILEFIETESVNAESDLDKFRVMQAVTTMQMSGEGIFNSIKLWSLVNRADEFNAYLFYLEDFDSVLETLPIVMVDNADSNKNNFNDDIMEIIIEFNTK